MGVAKETSGDMFVQKSQPQDSTKEAKLSAMLLNEFTDQVIRSLRSHPVNSARVAEGKQPMNCILARDSGNRYPHLVEINKKYNLKIGCIVDMPVEVGISRVLGMKTYRAGDIGDYEQKAKVAAESLDELNAIYVHIKGPDEFGHDGDARGKKKNIEEIDKRFFGTLQESIKVENPTIVVCGDHSTPCIKKAHSDDPIPLLISGPRIKQDGSARYTEKYGNKGSLGLLMGASVLSTAIKMAS
jgi:2,3-bisphosphoglycerate-independent phosphoglycerate mutase